MRAIAIGHVLIDCFSEMEPSSFESLSLAQPVRHIGEADMELLCEKLSDMQRHESATLFHAAGGGATAFSMAFRAVGGDCRLIGAVGDDENGRFIADALSVAGVENGLSVSDKPTGVFLSMRPACGGDSEPRLRVCPSAALDVRQATIRAAAFKDVQHLHIDGLLIDAAPWLESLVRVARSLGASVSIDVSTRGNAEEHGGALIAIAARHRCTVFANEAEYEALALARDPAAAAPDVHFIVKRGARGAAAIHGRSRQEREAEHIDSVDSTCAGDVFAAAFVHARAQGCDEGLALKAANAAAGATLGYQGSSFDAREVLAAYRRALAARSDASRPPSTFA